MKKYKVKVRNSVLGCPITIIDKIADDGYIYFTHTGNDEIKTESNAEVVGHLNTPVFVEREAHLQTNPHQIYQVVKLMANTTVDENNAGYPYINQKRVYARILIQRI